MSPFGSRLISALACAGFIALCPLPVLAQSASPDQKPAEQKNQAAGEAAKPDPAQRQKDELIEAGKVLTGPAANPECVWLGRRVVGLLSRDDLDTAFRHLDIYDRFGCPGSHIQATFRCLLKQGIPDAKAADTLNARVHSCWINPTSAPAAAQAAPAGPTTAAAPAPAPAATPPAPPAAAPAPAPAAAPATPAPAAPAPTTAAPGTTSR
jgi:hypothetical protein